MCSIHNAAVNLTEHWPKRRHSTAVAVGGRRPDLVIGKATTRGLHQSVLSKQLYSSSEVVVSQADSLVGGWRFSRSAGSSFTCTPLLEMLLLCCRLRSFFGRHYLASRSCCCC